MLATQVQMENQVHLDHLVQKVHPDLLVVAIIVLHLELLQDINFSQKNLFKILFVLWFSVGF